MSTATSLTVRDTIERSLADEPQSVVKVYETEKLRTDLIEYVLTDHLAREFSKVLERVIDAAQPAGGGTDKVGIWVSGFFGSGKSHFAKLAGHLLADTRIDNNESTRSLFKNLLHVGRSSDDQLRGLLQQATNYKLSCQLVLFDITALHAAAADKNVGLTFLRAFYDSLGLSQVIPFAECELELQDAGKYESFLKLYEDRTGVTWDEDKDLTLSSASFAQCLAELLPKRFATPELALQSLDLALRDLTNLNIDGVINRLLRWLDARQKKDGSSTTRLMFVADEVGAWAGRDLNRIEQIRSFVETIAAKGRGRIWLMATSQEKLSAVVQNVPTPDIRAAQELLQRLEARFQTNVHLESSEVGSVIEDRVLRKKPTARPVLEQLWTSYQGQLHDIGESPGLELGANYPVADRDAFVKDYPFLPYQIQASADIFGSMRGVKVSSGARSMIKIVFDATHQLADRKLGAVVSWDQIFDSANRDNEFADEQYLGSQGLTYIADADQHVTATPVAQPSRLLKTLWLIQKSDRIPRTEKNLARLLVNDLDADVLQLERDVAETLDALAKYNFVRTDVTTGQWKFLTQDEVTVEKIVRRLSEDVKQTRIRKEIFDLYSKQLLALFGGRITAGKSNTTFEYGVFLNDTPLKNDDAPVRLQVAQEGTNAAKRAEESAVNLDDPVVYWVLETAVKIEERLRRAIAIEELEGDEEYRQIATERTKIEAEKLQLEAGELRHNAEEDVDRAFQRGTLHWAGNTLTLVAPPNGKSGKAGTTPTAKTKVEEALRERIGAKYHRFAEGDRSFNPANIEKLFTVAASDRAALDPGLGLFSHEGHVHGNNVLVEELGNYLKSSTKTSGQDVTDHFAGVPFGWPSDLVRYIAAAMFVDGKLSAVDRGGTRYDDPKAAGARNLFGTAAFKNTKLEVEEEALTPAESTQARTLLTDLGHPPADGGEIALKDATLQLCNSLTRRLAVLDRARQVGLPLPTSYDKIGTTLEDITGSGSRVKIVRALLAHSQDLRDASSALKRLEDFDHQNGFAQYRRSQDLLKAALAGGVADDSTWGNKVQTASEEIQALKEQRRVLDEWDGAYQKYRLYVIDAFKAVYTPLREELHRRSAEATRAIKEMQEYQALQLGDRSLINAEFLGEGKPLHEVPLPELRDEHQLLAANSEFSIAHMRSALAALDSQLSLAKARVIDLYNLREREKGEKEKIVTWKPASVFAGKRFSTEAQVEAAFDTEKERLKKLVRDGKTVQVV